MTKIFLAAAVLAMSLTPAFAVTPKADAQPPAQLSVQAQIAALQQQVATLQKQVEALQSAHSQPVCISFWCGTVVTGHRAPV